MNKIIEIALKEVGYSEIPEDSNKTKYGKWFGLDGLAWCGMFVSWVYEKAGLSLPSIGFKKGFAGCQTAVAYFTEKGKVTTEPVEGDMVFFDWNLDKRFDHVGIFVKHLKDGRFQTIEGNTSLANQSNGGQVMVRERSLNKGVVFVHP